MNIKIEKALTILPNNETKIADIYIIDELIAGIDEAPEGFVADKVIDGNNKLLSAGFVNAHTHLYMSTMRNCADDLSFMPWLFENVIPLENQLTGEDAYYGTQLSMMEAFLSGTTCINDMHMFPHDVARALEEGKMRAMVSRGLTGDATDNYEGGKRRLNEALSEAEEYKNSRFLKFMLAPHAMYTSDEKYLKEIAEKAKELNIGIHTHLAESEAENRDSIEKYGMRPTEFYEHCGILTENTICAHCVYLSDNDIDILVKHGTSVAHNPTSNLKLANGVAPIDIMLEKGLNVALGTDGCCSNNNQSILKEMQIASIIHKGITEDPTVVTAKQVYDMATINGAKALGMGDMIGEIKVGKKADLVMFNLDTPAFFPLINAKAALSYASSGLNAETVMVNGEIVLHKGEFLTIDKDKVMFEVRKIVERLKGN